MGTRNLTMVIDQNGTKKISQYGQWDGYPSGVGADLLEILKDKELFERVKANLQKCRFFEPEGKDKDFLESYDKNASDPDCRTAKQKEWFDKFISRDLAAKVIFNIADSEEEEILLMDSEEAGKSGGWVEWSYVVNLKENTLSVHGHIDCPAIRVYDLNNLPSKEDFVAELEGANA